MFTSDALARMDLVYTVLPVQSIILPNASHVKADITYQVLRVLRINAIAHLGVDRVQPGHHVDITVFISVLHVIPDITYPVSHVKKMFALA